jgi:sialate O-acetylesterase
MKAALGLLVLCCAGLAGAAEPRTLSVAPVFGDQMVWPRDVAVPVWGGAAPRAEVEVRFADQVRRVEADVRGQWRVELDPLPANAMGRPLRISMLGTAGLGVRLFTNVVVGDVWLAAGQSNMRYPVRGVTGPEPALGAEAAGIRLLRFEEAATGDAGAYKTNQLARLAPGRYFTGLWRAADRGTVSSFSAVGWFFARRVAADQGGVPIGVIQVAVGGTPIEAWIDRAALTEGFPELVQGNWLDNAQVGAWCRGRARENLRAGAGPADDLGPAHPFKPGFQWAAGIAPLAPFPVKGVLWYQGESNAEEDWQIADHDRLFPLLVTSWRTAFGRDLPFLFVQLPGLQRPHWPAFRESQRRSLDRLPGLGMAVTIDLGDPRDVHPADKQPVGERLARLALNQVYGRDLLPTGPLPRTLVQTGDECRVTFDHARGLVTRDGEAVLGFETRAAEGGFQPARARIEGEQVVLPGPVHAVRYGWQPFPDPPLNLVNTDDLPASPFLLDMSSPPSP